MKDTTRQEIRNVGRSVEEGYISLVEAAAAKGCSKPAMLKWCEAHEVRHFKHHDRWLVHKQELAVALQRDLSGDAS